MANNYPIVLAHGIARFDFLVAHLLRTLDLFGLDLQLPMDGLNYFKGIARHLRDNGYDVYQSQVSFAAPLQKRAEDLRDEVNKALSLRNQGKVNIIAHSMGGLDARYMIVNHGMADKVATLTTIGTPHLGTSFADWGIAHRGDELIKVLRKVLDLEGFNDLTTAACTSFNDAVRNAEAKNGVFYQTYAASEEQATVFSPLQGAWKIIYDAEGDNDGLVSVTSQKWVGELTSDDGVTKAIKQKRFPVEADHLNEVAWWDLQELRNLHGWNYSLINIIRDYEKSIRNVYLDIARGL
jgi:triacylglycerol lipase